MRIQPWLLLRTRYVRREVLILYRQKYHRNSQMACAVLIIPRQNSLADASLLMEYRGTDPMSFLRPASFPYSFPSSFVPRLQKNERKEAGGVQWYV